MAGLEGRERPLLCRGRNEHFSPTAGLEGGARVPFESGRVFSGSYAFRRRLVRYDRLPPLAGSW